MDKDLGENLLTAEDHTNPTMDDTDVDSFIDGREVAGLLGGSDPTDPDSILIKLTGRITTTNVPPATLMFTIADFDDQILMNPPVVAQNNIYSLPEVPTGNYTIFAWEDTNGDNFPTLGTEFHAILGTTDPGVEFTGGSHVVILDFDLSSTPILRSEAPTFENWAVAEEIPAFSASADADADGDGIDNFIEYATNTDPNNPNSKPKASFHLEDTLGGLLPAENPGYRMLTVSHPWNGILSEKVIFEIQVSPDLNQGWTVLQPGDGILDSLSIREDRIEARIRCSDVRKILFTRFVFKESK